MFCVNLCSLYLIFLFCLSFFLFATVKPILIFSFFFHLDTLQYIETSCPEQFTTVVFFLHVVCKVCNINKIDSV